LAQITALRQHYRARERPEALRNLAAALRAAPKLIAAGRSLSAPRPYPTLAETGTAWVFTGRYWVQHSTDTPPVIIAVFYDQADIPGRLSPHQTRLCVSNPPNGHRPPRWRATEKLSGDTGDLSHHAALSAEALPLYFLVIWVLLFGYAINQATSHGWWSWIEGEVSNQRILFTGGDVVGLILLLLWVSRQGRGGRA
jgi:hypothetical protein